MRSIKMTPLQTNFAAIFLSLLLQSSSAFRVPRESTSTTISTTLSPGPEPGFWREFATVEGLCFTIVIGCMLAICWLPAYCDRVRELGNNRKSERRREEGRKYNLIRDFCLGQIKFIEIVPLTGDCKTIAMNPTDNRQHLQFLYDLCHLDKTISVINEDGALDVNVNGPDGAPLKATDLFEDEVCAGTRFDFVLRDNDSDQFCVNGDTLRLPVSFVAPEHTADNAATLFEAAPEDRAAVDAATPLLRAS